MMQTLTIDPLRWQEKPSRVVVDLKGDRPRTHLQVTSPMDIGSMCRGRPAEELPRILTILSPSHHLVSAMALDRVFGVEVPLLAQNIREALLLAQYYTHHLRKIFFLLSSWGNPFIDHHSLGRQWEQVPSSHKFLDEIMCHVGLSQEAASILGGRPDHPVTAVAGGVSCYLKEGHYTRLPQIAAACEAFAVRLSEFAHERLFSSVVAKTCYEDTPVDRLGWLSLKGDTISLKFVEGSGSQGEDFSVDQTLDKIGIAEEPWSFEPFTYSKEKGWQGFSSEYSRNFYFVGPLARMNRGEPLVTERAEHERRALITSLGPFPHSSATAAYWALIVELIHAAERMKALYNEESLTGPAIRNVPESIGSEGWAALESPSGFLFHYYRVNERGITEEVQILDSAMENNAIRCLLAEEAVASSVTQRLSQLELKKRVEISLLPF